MADLSLPDLTERIRQILLSDWDPHDASRRLPEGKNTYDTYIPALIHLIKQGGNERAIIDYLYDRERESMCFPGLGKQRLSRVAQKLMALKDDIVRAEQGR